jgi:hypothetical protein
MEYKMAKLKDKTGKKEYVSSRSTARTKDKFKDAVKGYVKIDAVRSTKLFRLLKLRSKEVKKDGHEQERIKKGTEEYGRQNGRLKI